MRKLTSFFMVFLMIISLSACSSSINAASDTLAQNNVEFISEALVDFTPQVEVMDGLQVISYFPNEMKATVLLFHGSGGSAAFWFTKTENALFINQFVDNGYGVIATESTNRHTKQWDPRLNSADFKHMNSVMQCFLDNGAINETTPLFGVGMSNGGGINAAAALVYGFTAIAEYCTPGMEQVFNAKRYSTPVMFVLAENDSFTDIYSKAQEHDQLLKEKSIDTVLYINKSKALEHDRFCRIKGISSTDSEKIYTSLLNGGYINDQGFLLNIDRDKDFMLDLANSLHKEFHPYLQEIAEELRAVYGAHQFTSDFSKENIHFFNQYIKNQ